MKTENYVKQNKAIAPLCKWSRAQGCSLVQKEARAGIGVQNDLGTQGRAPPERMPGDLVYGCGPILSAP